MEPLRFLTRFAEVVSSNDISKIVQEVRPLLDTFVEQVEALELIGEFTNADEGYGDRDTSDILDDLRRSYDEKLWKEEESGYPISWSQAAMGIRSRLNTIQTVLKDELQSLADTLNGFSISRPEEAQKFTRLRNTFGRLLYINSAYDFDEYDEGSKGSPDQAEKLRNAILKDLNYIAKYWKRLERYQALEKEFTSGPFTIVNEFGYTPSEYEPAVEILDRAASAIKARGFKELLYGKVVLTTQRRLRGDAIGQYNYGIDVIYLAVDYPEEKPATLIHEFGHRLWSKFLTEDQKAAFVSSFGWLSLQQLKLEWQYLEEAEFSLARALRRVTNPGFRDDLKIRWNYALNTATRYHEKYYGSKSYTRDRVKTITNTPISLRKLKEVFFDNHGPGSGLKEDYFKPKRPIPATSVTRYGLTSPEEDFCETFMFYCMGWRMAQDLKERFTSILGI